MKPQLHAPCYTCGNVRDKSYLSLFDIDGSGQRIVNICTDCLKAIRDELAHMNWDREGVCDLCMFDGSVQIVDGRRTCCDCLERESVQLMHEDITVHFEGGDEVVDHQGMLHDADPVNTMLNGERQYREPVFAASVHRKILLMIMLTATVSFACGWAVGVRDGGNNVLTVLEAVR